MWLLGHFALGYIAALCISKLTKEKINIPLVFFFSILPDFDLLISQLDHRGPTHSVIVAVLLFIPILLIFRHGLSYLGALLTHSMIGDFFTPPAIALLWPASTQLFESPWILTGELEFVVEMILFMVMIFLIVNERGK